MNKMIVRVVDGKLMMTDGVWQQMVINISEVDDSGDLRIFKNRHHCCESLQYFSALFPII